MSSLFVQLLFLSLFLCSVNAFKTNNEGNGTFFTPGLGACGKKDTKESRIVAVSHLLFDKYNIDANPNHNTLCGKKLTIQYDGKSTTATVTDKCPGCKGEFDLDLSPAVFDKLGDEAKGVLPLTWAFDDGAGQGTGNSGKGKKRKSSHSHEPQSGSKKQKTKHKDGNKKASSHPSNAQQPEFSTPQPSIKRRMLRRRRLTTD